MRRWRLTPRQIAKLERRGATLAPGALKRKTVRGFGRARSIETELDALCKRLVIARDTERCRRCGQGSRYVTLDCHHVVRRSRAPWMRWVLENLILLCKGCHFWWHATADADEVVEWCDRALGRELMEQLGVTKGLRSSQRLRIDKAALRLWLVQECERRRA